MAATDEMGAETNDVPGLVEDKRNKTQILGKEVLTGCDRQQIGMNKRNERKVK